METSQSISKIMPALHKAQTAMGSAKKGADNPYFKSKYADLGSVLESCKSLLNDNGITILQPHSTQAFTNSEGVTLTKDFVETVLIHESGEFIKSSTPVVVAKQNDPQALGSAITYARRYGLQSLLSIPAEDDDGEGAMARKGTSFKKKEVKKEAAPVKEEAKEEAPKKQAFRRKKETKGGL